MNAVEQNTSSKQEVVTVSMCSCLKTAGTIQERFNIELLVSTHSRLKAAGANAKAKARMFKVSTHSRSKAVGCRVCPRSLGERGFNTQPPEGGWLNKEKLNDVIVTIFVSTHSRLKAAGQYVQGLIVRGYVSTHSRLKAAGFVSVCDLCECDVSTHSRLKAAGFCLLSIFRLFVVSTHSRLKAAGYLSAIFNYAREVSTHSRLKAAGSRSPAGRGGFGGFNTQPPEGGWAFATKRHAVRIRFQHTAA